MLHFPLNTTKYASLPLAQRAPNAEGKAVITTSRFRFTQKSTSTLSRDLRQAVDSYFTEHRLSPHANAAMVLKSCAVFALFAAPYALVMSGVLQGFAALLACVAMGFGIAGIGFCIGHDALHGSYSKHARRNQWLSMAFEVIGANRSFWKLTHNQAHHTYTNVANADLDLTVADPMIRLSPFSERHGYHRWQHLYAWFLYALTTINWVFLKDYQYLLSKRFRESLGSKLSKGEVLALFAGKALHYTWSIVIPLLVLDLPLWQILIGFGVLHLTAGLMLSTVFQLAHVVEGVPVVAAAPDGEIEEEWFHHQLSTTANFAMNNRLLSWFVGGLNHQIEHHLFPRVCSIHYPALAPIVARVAKHHGAPYHHYDTLRSAIRAHYRSLKRLGTA